MKKAAQKKRNQGLENGRLILQARNLAKKSPKTVGEQEYKCLKKLLDTYKYPVVSNYAHRGINTVLRVKKSHSFEDYKRLLAIEIEKREARGIPGITETKIGSGSTNTVFKYPVNERVNDTSFMTKAMTQALKDKQNRFFTYMVLLSVIIILVLFFSFA